MSKTLLKFRPRLRSEWLSILTAVYLLFFMNGTFWGKSFHYLQGQGFAIVALAVGLLAAFVALHPAITLELDLSPRRVDLLTHAFRVSVVEDDYAALTGCAAWLEALRAQPRHRASACRPGNTRD